MKLSKITKRSNDAPRRKARAYDDACATAHALDLLGERWALLVVRELMFGPKRFGDIRADLPGISANVLTQRLEGLEAAGILKRKRLPPPASAQVYELTEWGYESEPIFRVMGRWGARSPLHDATRPLSASSLMLSLRTMFNAKRAGRLSARIVFVIGEAAYLVTIADGRLTAERMDDRQAVTAADLTLHARPEVVAAFFYGGVPLDALEGEGAILVEGDRSLARKLPSLFPLPGVVASKSAAAR